MRNFPFPVSLQFDWTILVKLSDSSFSDGAADILNCQLTSDTLT